MASFFKHLGTKASKFQFHVWIDNVVGVYPSNYSTDEHSTEGIYVILKRRNKSYRTKISLPENGGHVHMNDCINFTSTLYQKKRKNDELHIILPKPFTLRVCNGGNSKIRWESNIDISDYASVFGVDAQESFILQFVYKTKQKHRVKTEALQSIPSEITVRLRIKSTWLKNIDNISQASTDSISRMSSSALSDLSDMDNYKLYDTIPKQDALYNDDHQHKYHNILFTALPEDHSLNTQVSEKISVSQEDDKASTSPPQSAAPMKADIRESALESFAHVSTDSLTAPGDHGRLHSLSFDTGDDEQSFLYSNRGIRNLSFVQSSPGPLMENSNRDLDLKSKLSSPPITTFPVPANGSSSGLFMENELMRTSVIDHRMSKLIEHPMGESEQQVMEEDWDELIELMTSVCIDGMAEMSMDRRLWNNLIPIHSAVIFRCFIHWNVFEENEENTHLILQGFIDGVTRAIQEE
eukprot:642660_1